VSNLALYRSPRWGLGDAELLPADPLTQAGADLLSYLSTNGCSTSTTTQVSTFQTAWNTAANGTTLAVDGLYGPLTRAALQAVMNAEGTGLAPKDCVTPAAVQAGPVCPKPGLNPSILLVGGAITITLGVIGYTFMKG
jgi:hypothetical protein